MRVKIATKVNAPLEKVKEGFTEDLFLSLNPPFPPVDLIRFDGCKKGDTVALELNFILFRQHWISVITQDETNDEAWHFIDKGVQLPFFLKRWKHKHEVVVSEHGSTIIDDISFSTGFFLTNLLMYPALYLQFLYRKPIYKNIFKSV